MYFILDSHIIDKAYLVVLCVTLLYFVSGVNFL